MSRNEMPVPSSELMKSSDGRRYLKKLQERYKNEIAQPKNPDGSINLLFNKLYGDKIKRQEEMKKKSETQAHDQWSELQERKDFDKRDKIHKLIK